MLTFYFSGLVFAGLIALVSLVSMVVIWKSGLIDDMISQVCSSVLDKIYLQNLKKTSGVENK